jgi:hypothetical protein
LFAQDRGHLPIAGEVGFALGAFGLGQGAGHGGMECVHDDLLER